MTLGDISPESVQQLADEELAAGNSPSTVKGIVLESKNVRRMDFSNTSWIGQNTTYRVFSGTVDFASSGWTTITLDTPFEYNGTSNLLMTVDDNTNSYISGSSNSPQFYTYSTGSNTAIYKYNDYTNYAPASMSTSGTQVQYNNQIHHMH